MRGPLSVRIAAGVTNRVVTNRVRGLTFRKTAPGGHHSASCQVSVPRSEFPDLGPADKIYISDARSGQVIWEGYTESPGALDGPSGQGFNLAAMGGMVLLQDNSAPVVFVETALTDDLWLTAGESGGTVQVIESDTPGYRDFKHQFLSGQPVGTGSKTSVTYAGLKRTGQTVAAVQTQTGSGKVDAGYARDLVLEANGVEGVAHSATFTPTTDFLGLKVDIDFANIWNQVIFRIVRTGGATNVADDLTWSTFVSVIIRAVLKNKSGIDITSGFVSSQVVRAYEVVDHLLGSVLPMMDGPNAQVDTTTSAIIEQLAYHDGAKPARILDDLTLYEPDFFHEVLDTNPATGKHRFKYRAWPTAPRYEISLRDGYAAPGGDVDLCNRIIVYWSDAGGAKLSTVVTQVVPELGFRTRDAEPVTLPDGAGSRANATRVGTAVLASKTAAAPRAATATVRRPVVDQLMGTTAMPWEIEPGYVVRVRETGEDLRLTEVAYSDDSCSAQLTLGTPVLSTEQIVALYARAA